MLKRRSPHTALAGLELTVYIRLDLNSQICLPASTSEILRLKASTTVSGVMTVAEEEEEAL